MAPPHPSTAMNHVFELPELFNLILDHLSQPQILQAQRISKSWRDYIKSNKRLQEQLHLSPVSRDSHAEPSFNEYMVETFDDFLSPPIPEPSLGSPPPRPPTPPGEPPSPIVHVGPCPSMMRWTDNDRAISAFITAEASRRKMLVRQPPPRKLEVREEVDRESTRASRHSYIKFTEEQPFTMGLLYDIAQWHVFSSPALREYKIVWPVTDYSLAPADDRSSKETAKRVETDCVLIILKNHNSCCDRERDEDGLPFGPFGIWMGPRSYRSFRSRGAVEVKYDVRGEWPPFDPS